MVITKLKSTHVLISEIWVQFSCVLFYGVFTTQQPRCQPGLQAHMRLDWEKIHFRTPSHCWQNSLVGLRPHFLLVVRQGLLSGPRGCLTYLDTWPSPWACHILAACKVSDRELGCSRISPICIINDHRSSIASASSYSVG